MERAVDIFSSPGTVYGEVAALPVQSSSWVIPFLLTILIGIVSNIAILTNPILRAQAMEPQMQAMQERVDQGKMTQEQADQAKDMMGSSTFVMVIGIVTSVVMLSIMVFAGALVFWLAVKFVYKVPVGYKKMLEVYGLPLMIGVLGGILTLLMIYLFNSIYANPSGSLFVMENFSRKNTVHMLLASLNVFSIWQMVVLGIGLSKVSNKSTGSGVGMAVGLWIVWIVIMVLLGKTLG